MREKGQGVLEYALILVLVAIGTLGSLIILGPILDGLFPLYAKYSPLIILAFVGVTVCLFLYAIQLHQDQKISDHPEETSEEEEFGEPVDQGFQFGMIETALILVLVVIVFVALAMVFGPMLQPLLPIFWVWLLENWWKPLAIILATVVTFWVILTMD